MIVLSSKWKSCPTRVKRLEHKISARLKTPFVFDAKTPPDRAETPEGRLQAIGDFLEGLSAWRREAGIAAEELNAVVLEDFHISALGTWTCDASPIASTGQAEAYLQRRASSAAFNNLKVTLVHTYKEWSTPQGLLVQVGVGLTQYHMCRALSAFGRSCTLCVTQASRSKRKSSLSVGCDSSACNRLQKDSKHFASHESSETPEKVRKLEPKKLVVAEKSAGVEMDSHGAVLITEQTIRQKPAIPDD